MVFSPFPTAEETARLSHISLPLSGATLNQCKLDTDKIVLDKDLNTYTDDLCTGGTAISGGDYSGNPANNAFDNNSTTYWGSSQGGTEAIVDVAYIGYQFATAKIIKKVTFQHGIDNGVYCASTVYLQYWDGSVWVTTDTINLALVTTVQTFSNLNSSNISSTQWRLLAHTMYTTHASAAWYVMEVEMMENAKATSGTATFRVTPAQVAQYKQLIAYVKLNTNNTATYTIKSTGGITITGPTALSNGLNAIDISFLVSAETYKAIDVVITLARVSTSDTTPELHYVSTLVEGSKKELVSQIPVQHITGSTSYVTVLEITEGPGELTAINQVIAAGTGYIKVTVDGVLLINSDLTSSSIQKSSSILLNYPYVNNFKVEHKGASSSSVITLVSYMK